jgi:hypothetical protein
MKSDEIRESRINPRVSLREIAAQLADLVEHFRMVDQSVFGTTTLPLKSFKPFKPEKRAKERRGRDRRKYT